MQIRDESVDQQWIDAINRISIHAADSLPCAQGSGRSPVGTLPDPSWCGSGKIQVVINHIIGTGGRILMYKQIGRCSINQVIHEYITVAMFGQTQFAFYLSKSPKGLIVTQ